MGSPHDSTPRKQEGEGSPFLPPTYRTLFDSIDQGFCIVEVLFDEERHPIDCRFLDVNRVFEKDTGISDAVGRRMREIAPEHEERWFRVYGEVALTGKPARFENPVAALGRYYDVHAFRIGQPEEHRVAILFNDISERRRTEADRGRLIQELEKAQEQLRAELDATSRLLEIGSLFVKAGALEPVLDAIVAAAIAISGADFGNVQLLDRESGDLRVAAQRGFPKWWLVYWDNVTKGRGACGTALERGERVIIEDVETSPVFVGSPSLSVQLKAGVRAVQSTPLIGRSGDPMGMLSTHYKKPGRPSDRALRLLDLLARQAADMLERAQAERALEEANQRLLDADRRKNEFLGMLSHELRNPLAPIQNSLYVLERAEPGGEQARRAQAVIHRQVGHMTRLIDDLLDVTRITSGKIQLHRELLDLNEVAQRAVDDHRGAFADSSVRLELETAREPVPVNGDRTRLTQMIGNLLQNAVKFTPHGGRTVVSVERESKRGRGIVRVKDTGRGIAPEILPYLFEPFIQAEATVDRSKGGLGLGLALVRGLAEMHGGSVNAASSGPNQGATFTLTLPLETTAQAEASPPRAAPGATRRVLVIEDNVDAADMLREALELDGHRVEVANSGPEGIDKARTFGPDVVLCDVGLPEMDGYDVARTLRADPELRRVGLVALTGYAGSEDVARARAAGFDAHLAKPPTTEAIEHVLSDLGATSRGA
jgi:signal transduction histidine kinase/ActR/RegA family two-component response regulator